MADFRAATATELARLVTEARTARRHVAHRPCDDRTPCRHCAVIRDRHSLIDDHLDQLDLVALETVWQA